MNMKFWINTALNGLIPGGFGYSRVLRKNKDESYQQNRDKEKVREKHTGKEGWKQTKQDGFVYRDYESYEEYVAHQKSKFSEIIKIAGGFDNRTVVRYRLQFFNRFKNLNRYLNPQAKILCCGARQGTEVEVLRELGFENAYGIDLNPGPNNPFVRLGDFLKIDAQEGSLDLVYSNAVDHAFDLDAMFKEHSRVIKKDGYAYYDIALQEGGVFEAVHWDSDELVFQTMLKYFKSVEFVQIDKDRRWKSILLKGVKNV